MVKCAYQVEQVYPDRERTSTEFSPSIAPLKAFCWKVRDETFFMTIGIKMHSSYENFKSKGNTKRYNLYKMWRS